MFIPQGRAIYENLATSYVLIDSLVEDLCEGGFTGIVEVVLRDSDCHIVVNRGKVVAVTELRGDGRHSTTTLDRIARMSRQERGRVSVYAYTIDTTAAVSGRVTAEPVYTRLSTEFADPERMIRKFRREPDREWFVEVRIEGGPTGLIYLTRGKCLVVSSKAGAPRGHNACLEEDNPALAELMEECKRIGGSFDVYCSIPEAEPSQPPESQPESMPVGLDQVLLAEPESDTVTVESQLRELLASLRTEEESQPAASEDAAPFAAAASAGGSSPEISLTPRGPLAHAADDSSSGSAGLDVADHELIAELESDSQRSSDGGTTGWLTDALEAAAQPFVKPGGRGPAELMAEVKRLMAEITRAVENATRPGEFKDGFAIDLRAGQLKIADRYPFLDPFGSEFEYLAGEIVFVGEASPHQFAEGLTEAIKHAVDHAAANSPQPARMKARVENDLRRLLENNRGELEAYGLDLCIERITEGN
jgi:hypothetical protein